MANLSNLLAAQSNLVTDQDLAVVATTGSYTDLINRPVVISLKVSSIDYPGDDLAADTAGGQVLTLTGTGFEATPTVYIGGVLAPSVTFVSSTELLVTTPARTAGTYDIYVVNPGGATAIMVFGISYSGTPAWTTSAGSLGTFGGTFSVQLQATGDAPVSYSLTPGSVLPSGVTLSSSGLLTGSGISVSQAFNFSVTAVDGQNQDTPRSFLVNISIGEPFFKNVTMLLQGNGTNGGQNNTFLDSSSNNFAITRNGNTTQGSFSPYGPNWSNFFDGDGDFFTLSSNSALNQSGNFTQECWLFLNAYPSSAATTVYGFETTNFLKLAISTTGQLLCDKSGVGIQITGSVLGIGVWNHVALVRNGSGSNNVTLYLNGVSQGQATGTDTVSVSGTGYIARRTDASNVSITGYVSNLRVTNTAIYTSAFTPSTTPLTVVSGTSLLTCADNRFVDDSTNNFAITVFGNPSVQRFSPFAPPSPGYTTATIGGSGFFDGSVDRLVVEGSTTGALALPGDFTIETWVYLNSISDTVQAVSYTHLTLPTKRIV